MELFTAVNIPDLQEGLTVTVYDEQASGHTYVDGDKATIFEHDGTSLINPFEVDANGRMEFGAAGGLYDIKLGGDVSAPDNTWNSGTAMWLYKVALQAVAAAGGDSRVQAGHNDFDYGGSGSSSAYAAKGNMFLCRENVTLYGVCGVIAPAVAGATYQAFLVTRDGGDAIDSIVATLPITIDAGQTLVTRLEVWVHFSAAQALSAGSEYGILFSRTDGADNYGLPVMFPGPTVYSFPWNSDIRSATGMGFRIAKAVPALTDTLDMSPTGCASLKYAFAHG